MQAGANGQKVIDHGAAINMHLAASLFVLRPSGAAGESSLPAEPQSRSTFFSLPSAGSSSEFQKQRPKEGAADGANAALTRQTQKSLACVIDGAARASVVATELSNAPIVDLVAGVLDAEQTCLREEGVGDIVKARLN